MNLGSLFSDLAGKVIAGQVRTLLAVGGGYLVAHGMDEQSVSHLQGCLEQPIIGLGLWLAAGLWSAKAKVSQPQPPASDGDTPASPGAYPK